MAAKVRGLRDGATLFTRPGTTTTDPRRRRGLTALRAVQMLVKACDFTFSDTAVASLRAVALLRPGTADGTVASCAALGVIFHGTAVDDIRLGHVP